MGIDYDCNRVKSGLIKLPTPVRQRILSREETGNLHRVDQDINIVHLSVVVHKYICKRLRRVVDYRNYTKELLCGLWVHIREIDHGSVQIQVNFVSHYLRPGREAGGERRIRYGKSVEIVISSERILNRATHRQVGYYTGICHAGGIVTGLLQGHFIGHFGDPRVGHVSVVVNGKKGITFRWRHSLRITILHSEQVVLIGNTCVRFHTVRFVSRCTGPIQMRSFIGSKHVQQRKIIT